MPIPFGDTIPAILGVLAAMGAVAGWFISVGGKISSNNDAIRALEKDLQQSEDFIREAVKKLDHLRADYDTKLAAITGRFELVAGQTFEYREAAAKTFVTQQQLAQVEARTNNHIDRLVDRLEHISARLDDISHSLVEAISKMAPRQ